MLFDQLVNPRRRLHFGQMSAAREYHHSSVRHCFSEELSVSRDRRHSILFTRISSSGMVKPAPSAVLSSSPVRDRAACINPAGFVRAKTVLHKVDRLRRGGRAK